MTEGPRFYPRRPQPDRWCRAGIHRPRLMSAQGWIGYFTRIERRVCPCTKWEWVFMDDREVAKERYTATRGFDAPGSTTSQRSV